MVSQTFLSLTLKLGGDGAFWLYAGIAAAGMPWVYFALPETNGAFLTAYALGLAICGDPVADRIANNREPSHGQHECW